MLMLMVLYSQKLGSSQEELMETELKNLTRRKLHEIFTAADGIVRGAYQYLDSEGDIQTVNYIADNLGFKVAGTSLPIAAVDLPVPVIDSQNTEKYNPSLLI